MTKKRIGFTTSFPVEVVFAAGHIPIDLNNLFLAADSTAHIRKAEMKGFPRTICSWIKGNFDAALNAELDEVIGIVQGDCSNGRSLSDMISQEGIPVWHFSFPAEKDPQRMDAEIARLERHFGVTREQTEDMKQRLDRIRTKLVQLDRWTWQERLVTGAENHIWLVSASDFNGDPDTYEAELDAFLELASQREPLPTGKRVAYLGVPPIYRDIYEVIRNQNADVVFNEVQRQFAMPHLLPDIVSQYLAYTYPYSVFDRLEDIREELARREVDMVISYTQSFCHLQIDNILLKKHISLPFLTLEGDLPEEIDERTLLRIESFFEVHA